MYDEMMLWELGQLHGKEEHKLFQFLIDAGIAFIIDEKYSKRASELIEQRFCDEIEYVYRRDESYAG